MSLSVFENIERTITGNIADLLQQVVNLISEVSPIFAGLFSIYLMLWVFNYWANGGVVEMGVDFLKKLVVWSVVIGLVGQMQLKFLNQIKPDYSSFSLSAAYAFNIALLVSTIIFVILVFKVPSLSSVLTGGSAQVSGFSMRGMGGKAANWAANTKLGWFKNLVTPIFAFLVCKILPIKQPSLALYSTEPV